MIENVEIHCGDAREILATLPSESVHTCVTSPPYWGLRDYGVDGQIGLERTPQEYVSNLVLVFREVRRVLKVDGTLWLNLGDCYATGAGKVGDCPGGGEQGARWKGEATRVRDTKRGYRADRLANGRGDSPGIFRKKTRADRDRNHCGKNTSIVGMGPMTQPNRMPIEGLKPKDLVGIPWRVAFALQQDGWYLRSDIIWSKPNPMPESVSDRPTKSHEYIFLLSKSERYYYQSAAIAEESTSDHSSGVTKRANNLQQWRSGFSTRVPWDRRPLRNRRTVWTVATQPLAEAHFATFPPKLIKPCILAGCPPGGTVLDPFFGAGTTGLVAAENGCSCIGIEINPEYIEIARRRLSQGVLGFHDVERDGRGVRVGNEGSSGNRTTGPRP